MFGLGMQEILIILVIGVILFGAKRLPEIGSGLGKAIKSFKKGMTESTTTTDTVPTPKENTTSENTTHKKDL